MPVDWDAMSLEEREQHILKYAHRIAVREKVDGKWQSLFLTELPAPLRQAQIERLALRTAEPIRLKE